MNRSQILRALLCALALPGLNALGQQVLTHHLHPEVSNGEAPFLSRLPASQQLKLNIMLPLRDRQGLDRLLRDLYNPKSPAFRHFLGVREFADRFGASEADYQTVIQFAADHRLTVTGTFPNRLVVNVTGAVADVESAFHVTMGSYRHPAEQRVFYSADREPSTDLPIALWHVAGLDNFSRPHPASLHRDLSAKPETTGSAPGGYFIGSDLRAAYYGGTALTGSGQSIGILEFAGYNIADVNEYFKTVGQTNTVPVTGVSTDGSSLSCTGSCDDTEQVLDIEVAISMAPGMSGVLVYVSDDSDVSIFNSMASQNIAKSLSCSWGWSPADPSSDDPIFQEFAAQGQNLFVAAGDSGAYTSRSRDVFPADDANVISVGGTDLTTNGAGGAWVSETAWTDSGGGISPNQISIPSYQQISGVITSTNGGSTVYRNSPDVAAEANTDNFICYDGQCAGGWGGTSFAAPRWAGWLALLNQVFSKQTGGGTPGFLNPAFYDIGLTPGLYWFWFHDITSGSNKGFNAGTGYDLVTGWGSPNALGLLYATQ